MVRDYVLILFFSCLALPLLLGQILPPFLDVEQTLIDHEELTMIKAVQRTTGLSDAVYAKPVIHKIDRAQRIINCFSYDDGVELTPRTTSTYDEKWRVLSRQIHNQEEGLGYGQQYKYHDDGTIEKWTSHQWRGKIAPEKIHTSNNHVTFYYDEDGRLRRSEATGVRQDSAFSSETKYNYTFDEEGRKTEEIALARVEGEEEFTLSMVRQWQYGKNKTRYTYHYGDKARKNRQDSWYKDGLLVKSKWRGPFAKRICRFSYENGLCAEIYMLSSNPARKVKTQITYTYFYE